MSQSVCLLALSSLFHQSIKFSAYGSSSSACSTHDLIASGWESSGQLHEGAVSSNTIMDGVTLTLAISQSPKVEHDADPVSASPVDTAKSGLFVGI
jgi:hypothetical protein